MFVFFSSVLRVTSGLRVRLAGRKPMVYSADCSYTVVPVFVFFFVVLWFIVRGDLFFWLYVLPCVILLLCFSDLLA